MHALLQLAITWHLVQVNINQEQLLGDALIAHELAHVTQQQGASTSIDKMETSAADYNALEQDADRSAINVVSSLWSNTTW